jgi:IclR family acetate operon transcriptional repressor
MAPEIAEELAVELTTVPAVERALSILELIAQSSRSYTLSELTQELDLPKNAVFRITNTLRAQGYITRDDRSKRFALTSRLLWLASRAVEQKGLIEVAWDFMRRLRDATGETVQLGRRIGSEGVILAHVESLHPLRISVDAGLRFPLHNNAPGKLLLARLPPDERDELLATLDLCQSTDRTITSRQAMQQECETIAARGYSTDYAEADEGIHCVAAGITNHNAETVATIWVSAPSRRLPKSEFARTGRLVMDTASDISRGLQSQVH